MQRLGRLLVRGANPGVSSVDGENRLRTLEPDRGRISGASASGRNVYFRQTQDNPRFVFSAMVHSSFVLVLVVVLRPLPVVRENCRHLPGSPFIPPLSHSKPPPSQTGTKDEDEDATTKDEGRGRAGARGGLGAKHIQGFTLG
jgi:hypothetical protein